MKSDGVIQSAARLMIFVSTILTAHPAGADLKISHSDARETVLEMLKDGDSETLGNVADMIREYRTEPAPGTQSIRDGAYVGFVIQNYIAAPDSWKTLYDAQYKVAYKKNVDDITYEGLLDVLMSAVVANELPPEVKKTGDQIGVCLAKKVMAGAGDACKLDNSDTIPPKPSVIELGWMKLTCGIPVISGSSCCARKAVFNYAKQQLIDAKKQNVMAKVFPAIFPQQFRSAIIDGATEKRKNITRFISEKFGTEPNDSFWNAPLIDLQDGTGKVTGLKEVSTGLATDIRAAAALEATHPEMAAPLFYAASNRLLTLMGGNGAIWDANAGKFLGDAYDPNNPTKAPLFQTARFGGISFLLDPKTQKETAATWDVSSYTPSAVDDPKTGAHHSPLQLFPSEFVLGANGVPALVPEVATSESMGDLGELMGALMDYFELTAAGSTLSKHFAPSTDFDKIISDKDPAAFPREGRQLALGLMASAVQNLIVPNGHVTIPNPDTIPTAPTDGDPHSGSFGLEFYDEIGLAGRLDGRVPTASLAKVFDGAERLGRVIGGKDPDVPDSLASFKSDLNKAVDLATYTMIAKAQQTDGGFTDFIGDPTGPRSLDTQVSVLKTLNEVYDRTRTPLLRLCMKETWQYLDQIYRKEGIGSLSGPTLWRLLALWTQTKSTAIYADLMDPTKDSDWGAHGWDIWETRSQDLRKSLKDKLKSQSRPQDLSININ